MNPNRNLFLGAATVLVLCFFLIVGTGIAYVQNGLSIFLPLVLNIYPSPISFTPTPTSTVSPKITPSPTTILIFSAGPIQIDDMDDIYKINTDGTELVNLTNSSSGYFDLTWSPDGSRFAFHRQGGSLYIMNADGSGQTYLANGSEPSWSPDGSMIAFEYWDLYTDIHKLSVINSDGSGLRDLVSVNDGSIWSPKWSPNGNKIAYYWSDGIGHTDIFVVNSDGSGVTNLTNNLGGVDPLWSPDGSHILFGDSGDIYVMNADGTERTNISNSPEWYESYYSWSPVGSKIAYDCNHQICVMNPDGSGKTIVSGEKSVYSWPTWAPDGYALAFDEGSYASNSEIFIVNSDGTGKTFITDLPSGTWKRWLAWQP